MFSHAGKAPVPGPGAVIDLLTVHDSDQEASQRLEISASRNSRKQEMSASTGVPELRCLPSPLLKGKKGWRETFTLV